MRSTNCQQTVLDGLAPRRGEHARHHLERAQLCSRIAKIAQGNARDKLYRLKNENINAAIHSSSEAFEIVA